MAQVLKDSAPVFVATEDFDAFFAATREASGKLVVHEFVEGGMMVTATTDLTYAGRVA